MANNVNRICVCNIPIDAYTMQETLAKIETAIVQKEACQHIVVNVAKLVNAQKDEQLKRAITNSDIINADGLPIVWASRLLKKPLPERVAGIDLMEALVNLAGNKGYKIYFFGAKEDIVRAVVDKYRQQHGSRIIAGYRNGYYTKDDETAIARDISRSGADMLFVAITSPKKEIFLNTYKDLINIPFIMGVGGSFDVVAGKVKRAPLWMQRTGLEWFYRVLQEPRRMWKRYLITNSQFLYLLFKEKTKQIFGFA